MSQAPPPEQLRSRAADRLAMVRARVAELEHRRTVRASRKRLFARMGVLAAVACAPLLLLVVPRTPEPRYLEIVSSGRIEIEYQGRAPDIRVHRGLLERRTVAHAGLTPARGGR